MGPTNHRRKQVILGTPQTHSQRTPLEILKNVLFRALHTSLIYPRVEETIFSYAAYSHKAKVFINSLQGTLLIEATKQFQKIACH